MAQLMSFIFLTLNGFFKGAKEDIGWHRHGPEENAYAAEALRGGSTLVFGRVTYELMAGYWPTPQALKDDPVLAQGMNAADKIVFSRTLKEARWNNTRLVKDDPAAEIKQRKKVPGPGLTILGSGSIVSQLAERGLIDEYQVMIDPVALGQGTPFLKGITRKLDLELVSTRTFKSGVILLNYRPRGG